MSAPYYNLLSKVDRAIVAYIIDESAGTAADTWPAKNAMEKELPVTIVWAKHASETALYSGAWNVDVSIIVRTVSTPDYDETTDEMKDASEDRVAKVFDAFKNDVDSSGDALAAAITTAGRALGGDMADFTCQDVVITGMDSGQVEDTIAWEDRMELTCICCPRNVS